MSYTTTTPAQLVGLIYDDLESFVQLHGGDIHLTQNPFDLIALLQESPGCWRLTLHWEGDEPADPRVRDGRVLSNTIRIMLDGQLGLGAMPKLALIKETASRAPFLALIDLVRSRVMAYRFPWLAEPNNRFRYLGCDDKLPLPDGMVAAVYSLRFGLLSVMSEPETSIDLTLLPDEPPEEEGEP